MLSTFEDVPPMMAETIRSCPECGGKSFFIDHVAGELVCETCGMVVSSPLVNLGPEWRAFNQEEKERRTRTGAPITQTIHDGGLSTVIDWRGRDAYGRNLTPEQRGRMYRLRKWNRRTKVSDATERNLAYALSELAKVAFKLNLPRNVLETAAVIYRRVVKMRLICGRSIQGVVVASLYMACRLCNVVRSLEEVGRAANVSKKESGRHYRFLLRKLDTRVPPVEAKSYVSKFVNQFGLSGNVESMAMTILDQAVELRLTSGRCPSGLAAAATYITSTLLDEKRTQGEIARGAGVTEVTIRNRYKELIQKLIIQVEL